MHEPDGRLGYEAIGNYLRRHRTADALAQMGGEIVHDFNNAMAVALTSAEMTNTIVDNAEAKKFLAATIGAIRKSKVLTDHLAGPERFSRERVSVNTLICDLREVLVSRLAPSISLLLLLDAQCDVVETDSRMLGIALLNLVLNAGEAMPQGGICALATHARTLTNGAGTRDYAVISALDTGTGMTEDVREHAFDLFYSTRSPHRGLGLAQVKDLARRSDGFVALYSEVERGTMVRLALPMSAGPTVEC